MRIIKSCGLKFLRQRSGGSTAWRKCRRKQLEKRNKDRAKKRLGPGHGKTHKQMAYVGAVYTIAPWSRTTEQVTDDLLRKESVAKHHIQKEQQWLYGQAA